VGDVQSNTLETGESRETHGTASINKSLEATEVVTLDEHEILGREEHVVFLLSNIVTVTEGVPETKLTSGGQDCEGTEIHETARMSKALIETEVVTVGVQELGEKELHGAKTCLCSITLTATNEEVLDVSEIEGKNSHCADLLFKLLSTTDNETLGE